MTSPDRDTPDRPEATRADTPGVDAAAIRRWCERSIIPGPHPELSDSAAVVIASGHLTEPARAIMIRRMSSGLPIPTAQAVLGGDRGGFGELRRMHRTINAIEAQLGNPMIPGMVAPVLRSRRNTFVRRLDDARKSLVNGKGIFSTSIRGIRRERREGVHLELADRERLFLGLTYTPTPNVDSGGYVRRAGTAAIDRVAGMVGSAAARAGLERGHRWVAELVGDTDTFTTSDDARFVDGYETILFAAGSFYDRVMRCPAWHSEHFQIQRTAVDLHAELADIAADVIALRTIRIDLDASRRAAGFDADFTSHIDGREGALRPVWGELVERVAALASVAEVVESAAVELRVLAEFAHTATIDDRIDRLVARAGDREISADNTQRLAEQVRSGEEQLRIYRDVLQGNILRLSSTEGPKPR
ncbi:hypothetical protein [Williamsia sp. Leaf354]|uniref:hypothetical protein n=1 Tax=Williamsia sp. Leaf354 TaxID=1736349 RepID=UPI000B20CED5